MRFLFFGRAGLLLATWLAQTTLARAEFLNQGRPLLTHAKGTGEVGLAYRNRSGDYTFQVDGSHIRGNLLVPFRAYRDQEAVVIFSFGLTNNWEISAEVPYRWRVFTIDRGNLIDTENRLITVYPTSRPKGLGDARFSTTLAITPRVGVRLALKTASGADNFIPSTLPGSRPIQYLGTGQSDLEISIPMRAGKRLQLNGEVIYRRRMSGVSNYLLRNYKPLDEGTLVAGVSWHGPKWAGAGVSARYMHQLSATSISVLMAEASVWAAAGPWQLRTGAANPVYGKDYPALFPAQLTEPQPLMGPTFEAALVYRFNSDG